MACNAARMRSSFPSFRQENECTQRSYSVGGDGEWVEI